MPKVEIRYCRRHPPSVERAFANMRTRRERLWDIHGGPPYWIMKRGPGRVAHIERSAQTAWGMSGYVAINYRTECGLTILPPVLMTGDKGPQFEWECANCWRRYRHILKMLKRGQSHE